MSVVSDCAEKRESVVREIVTTERNYIRILQAILDLYQAPLEIQVSMFLWNFWCVG